MMVSKEDVLVTERIVDCLESTPIAVLATADKSGPWGTPVYFTYDNRFNFYVLSEETTRHVKHIKANPKVSIAIFMPPDMSDGLEVGIQIAGKAKRASEQEVEQIFVKRGLRLVKGKDHYKGKSHREISDKGGFFIKITPTEVYYLDRRYYGYDGRKVALKSLIQIGRRL